MIWIFEIWLLQLFGKNQYLCKNGKTRATSNWACICALYEHDIGFSLSSFDSTYDTNFKYSLRERISSWDPALPKFGRDWFFCNKLQNSLKVKFCFIVVTSEFIRNSIFPFLNHEHFIKIWFNTTQFKHYLSCEWVARLLVILTQDVDLGESC